MSDIQKKLEDYLDEKESDEEYFPEEDVSLMDKMIDFILNLDSERLSEEQKEEIVEIIDEFADSDVDLEDIDEVISAKKVKIKPSEKRKRRMEYRRQRAALKLKAKKYRRTTKFKQWKRMKARKARSGKTATGKRIRKFL